MFEILTWDTNFFGYKIARIIAKHILDENFKKILTKLKKEKVTVAFWSVDPGDEKDNAVAKNNNGFLADEKMTYVAHLPLHYQSYDSNISSSENKIPSSQLLSLVMQSGVYSRYNVDPNFSHHEYEKLYQIWIERSLKKEIAEDVLIYTKNGKELGFITIAEKNKRGDIGLLAVDKKVRGQGIGKALLSAAGKKAESLGFDELQVVTQKANKAACSLYEKAGFKRKGLENIYHFWLT